MTNIKFELIFGVSIGLFFWLLMRPKDHYDGNRIMYPLLFGALWFSFVGGCAASVNDITLAEEFALESLGNQSSSLRTALALFIGACTIGLLNLVLFLRRDKDDD
jgi:hypothetical protein